MNLDLQFHNIIVSIANNTYIEPFLASIQLHVLRLEYLFFQNFVPAIQSIEEHNAIIQALINRDSVQMEKIMSQNWLRPMKEIQKIISNSACSEGRIKRAEQFEARKPGGYEV